MLLSQRSPIVVPAGGGGGDEPLFTGADTSLFYDDYGAYSVTADLTGSGVYWLLNGDVTLVTGGSDWTGNGKYVHFNFTPAGDQANEIYTTQHNNALLNTATKVCVTYGWRNVGAWYTGKEMIIRDFGGGQRFVKISYSDLIVPQSLQDCWYDPTYPYPPLYSYVPPRGQAPAWSRDGLGTVGGPVPHMCSGNIGYPTAQFSGYTNNGNWHRFTYRFTREVGDVPGRGAYEGWLDGVKFMQFMGNNPAACEYGGVYTWGGSGTVWDGDLYFVGTTSGGGGWGGGGTVDMDGVRVWVPA